MSFRSANTLITSSCRLMCVFLGFINGKWLHPWKLTAGYTKNDALEKGDWIWNMCFFGIVKKIWGVIFQFCKRNVTRGLWLRDQFPSEEFLHPWKLTCIPNIMLVWMVSMLNFWRIINFPKWILSWFCCIFKLFQLFEAAEQPVNLKIGKCFMLFQQQGGTKHQFK